MISVQKAYFGPKLSLFICAEHLEVAQTDNDMSKHSLIEIIYRFKPIKPWKSSVVEENEW